MLENNQEQILEAAKIAADLCNRHFINSVQLLATTPTAQLYVERLQQHFVVHAKPLNFVEITGCALRSNALVEITLQSKKNKACSKLITLDPRDVVDPIVFDISRVRLSKLLLDNLVPALSTRDWMQPLIENNNQDDRREDDRRNENNRNNREDNNRNDEDDENNFDDDNDDDLNNNENNNENNDNTNEEVPQDENENERNRNHEEENNNGKDLGENDEDNRSENGDDIFPEILIDDNGCTSGACGVAWRPRVSFIAPASERVFELEQWFVAIEPLDLELTVRARAR